MELAINNELRPTVDVLSIHLDRMVVDFRDPIDGVCTAPLGELAGDIPTTAEIATAIEAVLGP